MTTSSHRFTHMTHSALCRDCGWYSSTHETEAELQADPDARVHRNHPGYDEVEVYHYEEARGE